MKFQRTLISLTVFAAIQPTLLLAEDNSIIVTATRTAQTADDALASVSAINREDIEASQAYSLGELLRSEGGIDITTQGSYGKSTQLYMRGTESDHVLVLVDGVRAASATTGAFAWENISLEQVERIEIVRGPRASLYGSDAIGGVVHIFTRQAAENSVAINYGSYNTQRISVTTAGGNRWKYAIAAHSMNSDGFPTKETETEDMGARQTGMTATLNHMLSQQSDLQLRYNYTEGSNEFDSSTGDSETKNQLLSVKFQQTLSDNWRHYLLVGNTIDQYTSYSPFTPSTITTDRNSLSWQNELLSGAHVTSVGLDITSDHASKDNSGIIDETLENKGLFLQQEWDLVDSSLTAALRHDQNNAFGSYQTGSLAWGQKLSTSRWFVSYGSAYKAPSVNDLYWPLSSSEYLGTTYITQGNTALVPEESNTLELGWMALEQSNYHWNINLYQTKIDNMIDWASSETAPSEYTYQPVNVGNVSINGLEMGLDYPLGKWLLETDLTLLKAINNDTSLQVDRRPEESLNLKFVRKFADSMVNIHMQYASERNDRGGSTILDSYSLVHMNYKQQLGKHSHWTLRIENLLNTDYALAEGYSAKYLTPGRSFYAGIKIGF
ncbi:MAG: TonB-dependent receptor [Gammaproteobacteria bacterium]|nr:TonB-dependent receptor [Gammaproteobacteria bacterium]